MKNLNLLIYIIINCLMYDDIQRIHAISYKNISKPSWINQLFWRRMHGGGDWNGHIIKIGAEINWRRRNNQRTQFSWQYCYVLPKIVHQTGKIKRLILWNKIHVKKKQAFSFWNHEDIQNTDKIMMSDRQIFHIFQNVCFLIKSEKSFRFFVIDYIHIYL